MTPLNASVVIYGAAQANDVARVSELLEDLNVTARVRIAPLGTDRRVSWIVLASLPTRILFDNMAEQGDAAGQIKKLVQRIADPGDGRVAALLLVQDTETGIQIVLAATLPEAAYRLLPEVDLIQFTFGPVHYDAAAGEWKSLLDQPAI
jgi:hypothetical protein